MLTVRIQEKNHSESIMVLKLKDGENVFITSHMGAASLESEHRSQVIIADCIDEFFSGKMPYNVKNPEVKNN